MKTEKLKEFIIQKLTSGLTEKLIYHDVCHSLEVLEVCRQYAKRFPIGKHETSLLETAALMHDTGYLFSIENHEEESKSYARKILPDWDYTPKEIDRICGMIEATKIPQIPSNTLEEIIGDADLDYLGTEAFFEKSEKLYHELFGFGKIRNRQEWNTIQIKFLQTHRYHTLFAQEHREPLKQRHLASLIKFSG